MSRIRGKIGSEFQRVKKEILAAVEGGSLDTMLETLLKLLPIRQKTRLPHLVDREMISALNAFGVVLAKQRGGNSPEEIARTFVTIFDQYSYAFQKHPEAWNAVAATVVELFKPVQLDFFVSPNATVELLRSAINIVSCQSETVNKFVELMDKKLDLKDADRLPLGLDATPKIPMPRESRPYYYADNLIYQYRVLWDNAHYAGVGAEMFDRKYGELLTSLRKAYPDETAKVTSRIVTELKKKGPLGDFGHMPADKKKALIAIMTEQPQKPKYVSAGYQPPAQLP